MKKFKWVLSCLLLSCLFLGCSKEPIKYHKAEQSRVLYHKTIEVIIEDARVTFYNGKSHMFSGFINVKSKEYNLVRTVDITNSSPYGWAVYSGQLKRGDKIKATLYSWKQGDKVVDREIGELIR